MLAALLAAAAAGAAIAAPLPAVRDAARGTYQPVVVTWLVWAALAAENGWSALATGQVASAGYALAVAAGCAATGLMGLRVPAAAREDPVRIGRLRLDVVCGAGAVAGLILLAATRSPATAAVVAVATDCIAYLPTLIRASPSEPCLSYLLYVAGGAAALAGVGWGTVTGWLYPLYVAAADGVMLALILSRRRAGSRACRSWVPSADPAQWARGGLLDLAVARGGNEPARADEAPGVRRHHGGRPFRFASACSAFSHRSCPARVSR